MEISILSMVFMAVSALLSIGTPILLFFLLRKYYKVSAIPIWVGVAAFVIFVLILESAIHALVLKKFALIDVKNQPALFMLYGALMAGLFEETARFLSFRLLKKKYKGIETGLSYGIGHGGGEAIILAGVAMIGNLVFSFIINSGQTSLLPESLIEAVSQPLTTTAPYMFLLSGFERIFAICVQISLSILVFYSVACKNKLWLYPFAILIHALIDCPAALMQAGVLKNVFIVEGLAMVSAVLLVYIAYITDKRLRQHIVNKGLED